MSAQACGEGSAIPQPLSRAVSDSSQDVPCLRTVAYVRKRPYRRFPLGISLHLRLSRSHRDQAQLIQAVRSRGGPHTLAVPDDHAIGRQDLQRVRGAVADDPFEFWMGALVVENYQNDDALRRTLGLHGS